MPKELINANPVLYGKKERRVRSESTNIDEYAEEPIDQQEIFDHVRDIKDPEHPYSLEELNVVSEGSIEVNGEMNYVRITFTPTVEHCSMATIIGLCLRVKLMRSLPSRYKNGSKHHKFCPIWHCGCSPLLHRRRLNGDALNGKGRLLFSTRTLKDNFGLPARCYGLVAGNHRAPFVRLAKKRIVKC